MVYVLPCQMPVPVILNRGRLKKIKNLGFGGPGQEIHVLKEHKHSRPAPVLEGEGRIYNIFGVRAF